MSDTTRPDLDAIERTLARSVPKPGIRNALMVDYRALVDWLAYTRLLEADNDRLTAEVANLREYLRRIGRGNVADLIDANTPFGVGGLDPYADVPIADAATGKDAPNVAEASPLPTAPSSAVTDARGVTGWQPGDEPAEASIRRQRDGGDLPDMEIFGNPVYGFHIVTDRPMFILCEDIAIIEQTCIPEFGKPTCPRCIELWKAAQLDGTHESEATDGA